MVKLKVVNGYITDYKLYFDENGFLVMRISLETGEGHVDIFGTYTLGYSDPVTNLEYTEDESHYFASNSNYCAYFISKVMEVTEARSLDEIKGKPIRAIFKTFDNSEVINTCVGIQHLIKDGIFFIPSIPAYTSEFKLKELFDENMMVFYNNFKDGIEISQNFLKIMKSGSDAEERAIKKRYNKINN